MLSLLVCYLVFLPFFCLFLYFFNFHLWCTVFLSRLISFSIFYFLSFFILPSLMYTFHLSTLRYSVSHPHSPFFNVFFLFVHSLELRPLIKRQHSYFKLVTRRFYLKSDLFSNFKVSFLLFEVKSVILTFVIWLWWSINGVRRILSSQVPINKLVLYILTSVSVLPIPNAGQNIFFLGFCQFTCYFFQSR